MTTTPAPKKSLGKIFLEIAQPDEQNESRWVTIEELVAVDDRFRTGNGGSWCRDDGPLKDYRIERQKEKNKIVRVRLTGRRENPKERNIKPEIAKQIKKKRCVVLDIGSVEVDHKNGMYETDPNKQVLGDFQPLSKAANNAKREHCKKCKDSGRRYDARNLNFAVGWLGSGTDNLKQWGCDGCYWYDPAVFHAKVSKKAVEP